jgi:hypothetical protein
MRREREYIQLHRDTTVQALTLSPTLRNGVVVYEDSALVRSAVHGRVLMVDEADKAPLEVLGVFFFYYYFFHFSFKRPCSAVRLSLVFFVFLKVFVITYSP